VLLLCARIDPGNTFRLDVKVFKYVAVDDYGVANMDEQGHQILLDRTVQYGIEKFLDDMATKIIWGRLQTLEIWVVDADSESTWKVRRDDHFEQLISERWNDRFVVLAVEVVNNYNDIGTGTCGVASASEVTSAGGSAAAHDAQGSVAGANAGIGIFDSAEGYGDTYRSPPPSVMEEPDQVDWAELTILVEPDEDGDAKEAADEDQVYEAMGFKATDERAAEEAVRESVPIPTMTAEMQSDMVDAAVPVDDNADEEPLFDWDRDNPDLFVGICYPSMVDFRLAVRQHAIVKEFELQTAHSDPSRFRGCYAAAGCPWIIRARTQHDGSVRVFFCPWFVLFLNYCVSPVLTFVSQVFTFFYQVLTFLCLQVQVNDGDHICASRSRVEAGKMASQGWVAERAIPLLNRKPNMGPKELQEELQYKYNIEIAYQTVVYGR
jgi:hypothetical protein